MPAAARTEELRHSEEFTSEDLDRNPGESTGLKGRMDEISHGHHGAGQHAHWHILPRDFARRRRVRRLIGEIVLVGALSLLAAYAITRSSQGTAFTPPKGAKINFSQAAPDAQKTAPEAAK